MGQHVHGESQVGLRLGCQDTGGAEAGIVDEQRIVVARPLDAVGRIADDGVELQAQVGRRREGVAQGNVEIGEVDAVQKHVDAAQVVGRGIDFLPEVLQIGIVPAHGLGKLQQQGAAAAGGVVHAAYLRVALRGQAGQQLADALRRKEFAAALAGAGGIHLHEVFVGIAEDVVLMVGQGIGQLHAVHRTQHLGQQLVALGHGVTQLFVVHSKVAEQAAQVVFRELSLGRVFDGTENAAQRLVQVLVSRRTGRHVGKELRRQDEVTLLLHHHLARLLGLFVAQAGIVEGGVAPRFALQAVDVGGHVFGYIAVEEGAQHVALELPAIDGSAQVVGYFPYRAMQFGTFLFVGHSCEYICL